MESTSKYFSPKKTRNFVRNQQLNLNKPPTVEKEETLTQKLSKRKINKALTIATELKSPQIKIEAPTEPTTSSYFPLPKPSKSKIKTEPTTSLEIKLEEGIESKNENEKLSPTPTARKRKTPIKIHPADEIDEQWEPTNWRQMIQNIREMRKNCPAPVDTMGCDKCSDDDVEPKVKRYHCLISLILSSQTKDQTNWECMNRLKKHGLTPAQVVVTDVEVLEKLIYPVSFYKTKAKHIIQTSNILIEQYDHDIPNTLDGLLKLPGVGMKMAQICMKAAWNIVTGIGVDTHVHRISNWLKFVPRETKTPEETRKVLEKWLPFEMWDEINHMLVGFGQTICTPVRPKCDTCMNADICPARNLYGGSKKKVKKEIKVKMEDLEF